MKTIINETDDLTLNAIRRKVHEFFFRNEIPTIDKIMVAVNDDPSLPTYKRSMMHKILVHLNFKFGKRNRNNCMRDRKDIILWRLNYLRQIKRYRAEGRKIYYLDERWLNAGHTKEKVWQDLTVVSAKDAFLKGLSTGLKSPSGKGKRIIILHIGNENGFVENGFLVFELHSMREYHEEMDGKVFCDWFERVSPLLDENCVIVMDNAPYHSVKMEKIPTTAWNKKSISDWLRKKQICQHENLLKLEMLQLVKQHAHKYLSSMIWQVNKINQYFDFHPTTVSSILLSSFGHR